MPTASTPNLEIYYELAGAGRPVLFISGSGMDLRVKPNVMDGPLPRTRQVLAYDQRGLGQTAKPAGPYSMADYADDAAAMMDVLQWPNADVIGVSFGGMVALHLALRHPQRINRLVLCCTSPGGSLPSYPFHELPTDLDPMDRARRLMGVNDLRCDAAWQRDNPEQVARMLAYTESRLIEEHQSPEFRRGYQCQLEARSHHDVSDQLDRVSQPTLICAGRYDGIAPAENQQALLAGIPDARLQWYEGGHYFMVQDRAAWKDIIDFLED